MSKKSLPTSAMLESEDEFAQAYESYGQRIYTFLFWRTKDREISADLASNVFEKAWRSRQSFRGGSVQAWLYRIAHNELIDHWRKKKDVAIDDIELLSDEHETAAERLDKAMEVERLQTALAALPNDMRQVVELRFMHGLSARQVAARLDMSEGNVRVVQYRALQKMRQELS